MKDWAAIQSFKSGTFPDVLAINSTGAATQDGTEYIAEQVNNGVFGWMQDLMDYASLTPDGVIEAAGTAQIREAIQLGNGIGPGLYVQWGKFDDPSVTGDRVLLLSGQGVLISSFTELVDACYVGDGNNGTALFFYKADAADGLVRDTAGPFFILPDSKDYLFPDAPQITTARWHTQDGYGSSSTKIRKFTTEVVASDDVVVTVVNSATLGYVITANIDCALSIIWTHGSNTVGAEFGFSLNSSELTTDLSTITTADRLAISNGIGGAGFSSDTLSEFPLSTGDVIRLHSNAGSAVGPTALESVSLTATEAARTTNTIVGITF